ncbi:zinc finger MYM-type protein 1-like [Heracleum sosnowskyi]|uniref:Zinc finger MYM-type protein 1-like n=1 Tax=Heracleum sosnowskyi TaxID=360622 RepID=A0AAD8J4M0_9APIA|nr:zinc finger MYM-type protein 1-like [Heracleum sosnowskyi]
MQQRMDKFLTKTSTHVNVDVESPTSNKRTCVEFNPENLISDPGRREQIDECNVNIRDQVRRAYLAKGPCQPLNYKFPKTQYGIERRSFQKSWFKEFDWLEYSIKYDRAYCLWCYLFKPNRADNSGRDVFSATGFNNWKRALEALEVFRDHIGSFGSSHNEATRRCQAFKNQKKSVSHILSAHGLEIEVEYRNRLTAVLSVIRLLLQLGLPFRGHNESSDSIYKGNFLEVLEWYCQRDDQVAKFVGPNAPGNCQLTSPKVQKELVNACAIETRSVIFADIGDKYFSLMVDESRDISLKEQMVVVLRYVNKHGQVIERFISIEHVLDTSSQSLKNAIDGLFLRHGLSLSQLRGQGYDGASNMSDVKDKLFLTFTSIVLKSFVGLLILFLKR